MTENNNKFSFLRSLGDGKFYKVEEILEQKQQQNIKYRIGVDSLNIKDKSIYIVSLVGLYPNNSGAFVYYQKQRVSKINNIEEKLWKEVELSVSFGTFLRDQHKLDIELIEFDFNENKIYPSSKLIPSATGYAEANGFKSTTKPSLLLAISASNHTVNRTSQKYEKSKSHQDRNKNKKRKNKTI